MTLRDTVARWHAAMCLMDKNRLTEASQKLLEIQKPSARILYNLGCLSMLKQRYEDAIQYFSLSIDQDKYLAIACYQRGICFLEGQRFEKARLDFLNARSMIRGEDIDYKQLGAEVVLTKHLLDQWIYAAAGGGSSLQKLGSVHALPVRDSIFQPPKGVVDNLVKQDFLGSAKVISSTTENDIAMASGSRTSSPSRNPTRNSTSCSVPSSPTLSRCQINTSSAKKIFIPPPTRPPPRLPGSTTIGLEIQIKSQSLEDLASCDHVPGNIEADRSSLSYRSATTKQPNSFNNLSLATSEERPGSSKVTDSSHRPYIIKNKSNCGITSPNNTTQLDRVEDPVLTTSHSQSNVGRGSKTNFPNNATTQNRLKPASLAGKSVQRIVGKQNENPAPQVQDMQEKTFSTRPDLGQEIIQKRNLGQREDSDSGQSSSAGHAARMRSLFEQGQRSEVNVGNDQKGAESQRKRFDVSRGGSEDIAQRGRTDIAWNRKLDLFQGDRSGMTHDNRVEIALRDRLDIAQNRPDVAQNNKPDEVQWNRRNVAHSRPDIAQNRPDIAHSKPIIAQTKPIVPHSKPNVALRNRPDTSHDKNDLARRNKTDAAQMKSVWSPPQSKTNIQQPRPTPPATNSTNPQKSPKPVWPPPPNLPK